MYDAEQPPRPERPAAPQRSRSLMPVVLVLVPISVFITGVVAFTGQAGLLMLAAVACIPAFMVFHYVLWGRWLSKSLQQQADEEPH